MSSMQNGSSSYEAQPQQSRPGRRSTLMGPRVDSLPLNPSGSSQEPLSPELPMYKDKPVNYGQPVKNMPFWRRPRLLVPIVAFIVFIIFLTSTSRIPKPTMPKQMVDGFKNIPIGNPVENILSGKGKTATHKSASKPASNWADRRERVKDAFRVSWKAYEENAWGFDEYKPNSKQSRKMTQKGLGWIIVDSLDTMMLMNLTSELAHAREWLATSLDYDQNHDVSVFETTIRMLGGLLSAHYLSTEFPDMAPVPALRSSQMDSDLYLELATDLADRLLGAFNTPTGIPYSSVNLQTRMGIRSHTDGGAASTAEATTVQLELKYLAKLTGEKNYWEAAEKIMQVVDDNGVTDNLVPIFLNADTGKFQGSNIRLGSRGDSYYEYLIKQYLQTNKQEKIYLDMWDQALMGIRKRMITYTKFGNLTVLGELPNGIDQPVFGKMDHLVCFMPGTIALAATEGQTLTEARMSPKWNAQKEVEMELARQLAKTCWGMYLVTTTGLSPEITHFRLHEPPIMMEAEMPDLPQSPETIRNSGNTLWRQDYDIHVGDMHNLQRPEFVETLYYMYRITGDELYREWGWKIFSAFMDHTAVPNNGGYSSVESVDKLPPPTKDNMESFWLAETLKYLYLLFSPPETLALDQVVFNTEAHPLPRFDLGRNFQTGWKRKPRDSHGNIEGREVV